MSAENLGLGELIDRPQQRDAIHVAVVPMICGAPKLKPGEHIGLMEGYPDHATNDTDITETIDSKLIASAKAWIANYLCHGGRFEGIHVDDEF